MSGNQHIELMNALQGIDATIQILRGPVLYEYPPITLILQSRCEDPKNGDARFELSNDQHGGSNIIRFSRECPKIECKDIQSVGLVILNKDSTHQLQIMVQNMERATQGSLQIW